MEFGQPEKLDYAPSPRRVPLSRMAVISFVLAAVAVPVSAITTSCLESAASFQWVREADRLGFASFIAVAALGLAAGTAAWLRIREARGALRGRPVALVAITINAFWLAWSVVIVILGVT